MIDDLPALTAKYRDKGVLLDSNLLVLLFVGLADPNRVSSFKRTQNQGFTEREFSSLQSVVEHFSRVITTPHILTETSNYICQLHGEARQSTLQLASQNIQSFKERRQESKNLVQTGSFFDFGLTDSAILDISPKKYLVLSVDAALVIALRKKGVDAINFNRIRQLGWEQ